MSKKLSLTLACGDYEIVRALKEGTVEPDGIELTMRLAEAGCEVVVNGLDSNRLEATADAIRKATGAKVHAVAADVATKQGQDALFAACPEPDILIANNAGPPFRDFRELDRQKMIDGVVGNMRTLPAARSSPTGARTR